MDPATPVIKSGPCPGIVGPKHTGPYGKYVLADVPIDQDTPYVVV